MTIPTFPGSKFERHFLSSSSTCLHILASLKPLYSSSISMSLPGAYPRLSSQSVRLSFKVWDLSSKVRLTFFLAGCLAQAPSIWNVPTAGPRWPQVSCNGRQIILFVCLFSHTSFLATNNCRQIIIIKSLKCSRQHFLFLATAEDVGIIAWVAAGVMCALGEWSHPPIASLHNFQFPSPIVFWQNRLFVPISFIFYTSGLWCCMCIPLCMDSLKVTPNSSFKTREHCFSSHLGTNSYFESQL